MEPNSTAAISQRIGSARLQQQGHGAGMGDSELVNMLQEGKDGWSTLLPVLCKPQVSQLLLHLLHWLRRLQGAALLFIAKTRAETSPKSDFKTSRL